MSAAASSVQSLIYARKRLFCACRCILQIIGTSEAQATFSYVSQNPTARHKCKKDEENIAKPLTQWGVPSLPIPKGTLRRNCMKKVCFTQFFWTLLEPSPSVFFRIATHKSSGLSRTPLVSVRSKCTDFCRTLQIRILVGGLLQGFHGLPSFSTLLKCKRILL